MALLRVGQKVVVSESGIRRKGWTDVARSLAETERQGVITEVDDDLDQPYRVAPEGADYDGWYFRADELTAVPDAAPARETEFTTSLHASKRIIRVRRPSGHQVSLNISRSSGGMITYLTPDEADQLGDMLHAAAAEARGTGRTP